ncbi:D-2-hydroxyacid dehydrogenase [Liquorilactobacillus mali]|uniref:Lactate dehydrogenase or related 2-hydroxyacid dehydrogenase n=1 Tax=Liquorilactobacillus mali KCTC 3596 = DSM 20444 TaxID=1046596 RepID=J0KYM4_9LACO|nr:D-2-hydroxyacid dehydrogenase [Liquorilactobacillus mali]EJE99308.1 lactate dehydrogenase [Liquorilactobacillus mali KCTC 3596 = DSM 20444]KRN10440.1 lactate dehydrogenase or related 2-hydroxyacid dehydrogenase [Liquorilactobacillus mali KCTC 3596 = DSM 20444]QFQ74661.1 D-2-hydroxyacid dehydrogenase [Liquorilactobacillus mali]
MKIIVLDGYALNSDLDWDLLKQVGDCTLYDRTGNDDEEIIKKIGSASIVLTHKTPIDAAVIEKASNLKYIGVMGTGYDVIDMSAANSKNIVVTNVPTYGTDAVAQYTFALLLEITSQVGIHNQLVHNNEWSHSSDFTFWAKPLIELKGKTLGLIGFGKIAQKVAEIAHSFSMNIIFYNHRPKDISQNWIKQVGFNELLEKSDIISLHVIQTTETINLISKAEIHKMKTGAILINTARGKLINEADLADALNNGKILAAGLDVVSSEPIKNNNPLLQAKNCFITPHIAWAPKETRSRLLDISINNLKSFLAGTVKNQVI